MSDEYRPGVKATIGPKVFNALDQKYIGKTCTISSFGGSTTLGNYYLVTLDDDPAPTPGILSFYTFELDVSPILTKEEKAAKLREELDELEAEIKREAEEKANGEIKTLGVGSLIELGVDDTNYVVKAGENRWKWFSLDGDPLCHHDTTDDGPVIAALKEARLYGYCKVFPANED